MDRATEQNGDQSVLDRNETQNFVQRTFVPRNPTGERRIINMFNQASEASSEDRRQILERRISQSDVLPRRTEVVKHFSQKNFPSFFTKEVEENRTKLLVEKSYIDTKKYLETENKRFSLFLKKEGRNCFKLVCEQSSFAPVKADKTELINSVRFSTNQSWISITAGTISIKVRAHSLKEALSYFKLLHI
jgi:hypothetical protein